MDLTQLIESARSVEGIPFKNLDVPFSSLGDMLNTQSQSRGDTPFLIFYDEDGGRSEYSYTAFRERVQSVAGFLLHNGISAGDRIATLAHNHSDTVIQYFAAWWIGATIVPLNSGEDDDRLQYILENSKTKLVFVQPEYLDRATALVSQVPAVTKIVVCSDEAGQHHCFTEALHFEHPALEPRRQQLAQECLIVYTSGTTGNPKGVVLAHGNLLADAKGISAWHRIAPETRMMCVLPIHHVNGTVVTLVTPMYAGSSVVLNRRFQSTTFFQRAATEAVSIVSVVPTLLAFLIQGDISTGDLDLQNFRHIICGAGPLTCELAERFENRYGIPVIHGYGLSETTCYSCFLPVGQPDKERKHWLTAYGFPSIGIPIPENEMAIHDEAGNALEPEQKGEIVIRGHNVMIEYYENRVANENAFTQGWFRSGDEGFFALGPNGEHYFFITGRLKELIIRGGVNVSPLEIDEVLNSHPGVAAGIAVGFENNWYGEEVGAYVRKLDESLTEEALLEYCHAHLPFHKAPKVVVFGEDIPVTSTGKYQRNRVKGLFSAHKETQFSAAKWRKM